MKYIKEGFCIQVPINNDYTVRCKILKEENEKDLYNITLEIKRNDIGKWDELPDDEVFTIESKRINLDASNYISKLHKEGYFSEIIKNYEYWIICGDIGNSAVELASSTR